MIESVVSAGNESSDYTDMGMEPDDDLLELIDDYEGNE